MNNSTFIGKFCYQDERVTMQTEAATIRQAWLFFCYGLAKQRGLRKGVMTAYFNGTKNNYEIKKEVKINGD